MAAGDHTPDAGLTSAEAARLLAEVGPNEVEQRHESAVLSFVRRYWGPMPWLLELAAALALVVGHPTEVVVILVLLTVNAVVGQVLHLRKKRMGDDVVRYAVKFFILHRVSPPIRAVRVVCCLQPYLLYTAARIICKSQMLEKIIKFL